MAYGNSITKSIHGRQVGLQTMSTAQTGGSRGTADFLVGAEAVRSGVTTSESTGTNLAAWGVSHVKGTSVDSSSVFVLDPPIPGIEKLLYFNSTGNTACYVKTANSETIHSTIGSSHTTIKSTLGGVCRLIGVTTAIWAALITSGTSSNAGGFAVTTST